jgi:transposase
MSYKYIILKNGLVRRFRQLKSNYVCGRLTKLRESIEKRILKEKDDWTTKEVNELIKKESGREFRF